jgi:type I restriction enzyme S subunit
MMFCKETDFQDSPIGKIPKDWDVSELDNICEKAKAGGTPLTTNKDYWNGNIPFVKIEDMTTSGKYLAKTQSIISKDGLANSSAWMVPENSLLLAMYGSMGEISINRISVATNQAILGIIPRNREDVGFLYYWYLFFKPNWKRYAKPTTQANLTAEIVRGSMIPLPPENERKAIVGVLGVVDSAIGLVDGVIWKTERLKKGLMQTLLTKGIGHKEFKDTEIGKIPEEWKVFKLRDVCYKIQDGTHFSPKPQPTGVPYVTSKNIRSWGIDLTDVIYVAPKDHLEIFKRCDPKLGDLLYVKDGVNTGTVTVNTLAYEFTLLSSVAMIRPNPDFLEPWFLKHALDSPNLKKRHLGVMTGTAIRRLTLDRIKNLKVPVPNMAEQRKISEILSTIDTKSRLENKKKAKLQRIKRGLMDLLLTGKVRVKVD